MPVAQRLDAERPLRVLHMVCGRTFAGTEKHVLALSGHLRARGCEVELACPRRASELRAEALRVGLPVRPLLSLRRADAPDVVHVHDGRSAILGYVVSTLNGSALVRTQHFVQPASAERSGWKGKLSHGLHRLINRRLDGYICVSQAAARAAEERRDVTSLDAAVIPPGVVIPSSSEVELAAAARLGTAHAVVLSAGRLEPERRFDVLLDGISAVLAEIPDCRFVIAGAGSVAAELKAQARALGIESALTWTGWLPDLAPYLAQAHVYVNTWPFEGFGMATAEAMGFALPVIVANSGASPELVEDQVSGRIVAPVDPKDLAVALIDLVSDLPRAAAMGRLARERAISRYSSQATGESTLAFYASLPRVKGRG